MTAVSSGRRRRVSKAVDCGAMSWAIVSAGATGAGAAGSSVDDHEMFAPHGLAGLDRPACQGQLGGSLEGDERFRVAVLQVVRDFAGLEP